MLTALLELLRKNSNVTGAPPCDVNGKAQVSKASIRAQRWSHLFRLCSSSSVKSKMLAMWWLAVQLQVSSFYGQKVTVSVMH